MSEYHGAARADDLQVLKSPVSGQIIQLVISPQGDYLAIVTLHTVHIAVLPDSVNLTTQDGGPLKLKTFHLGPTTHVLEQPPIASVIWHPHGYMGRCLVTVTTDAIVRIWELNKSDRWSFSEPTLAVDLKKLADAVTSDDDVGASICGAPRVFSPDFVEMEVASACFGDIGGEGRADWASLTLWVAMKAGDVYALCPLLPSKWQASLSLVNAICTSVLAEADDINTTEGETISVKQRLQWITEVGNQEGIVDAMGSVLNRTEAYSRPSKPGAVPQLQGPFLFTPDLDDDADLVDIHAVGAVAQAGDMLSLDDWDAAAEEEVLSVPLLCLSTTSGKIHICTTFEPVQAKWLPPMVSVYVFLALHTLTRSCAIQDMPQDRDDDLPTLLTLETIKISSPTDSNEAYYPVFTADAVSRYNLYITDKTAVFSLSLSSLARRLEEELSGIEEAGTDFRINLFLDGIRPAIQHLVCLPREQQDRSHSSPSLASCIVLQDSDIGYFVLTTDEGQPHAVTLLEPESIMHNGDSSVNQSLGAGSTDHVIPESRSAYQPPQVFWSGSALPSFTETRLPPRYKRLMKDEIKLSPAMLEIMTEAHRILSHETHQLGLAAADLFRRCERLRDEFTDQIRRTDEVAKRIEGVVGDDEDEEPASEEEFIGDSKLERRLESAKSKQREISSRHEKLKIMVQRLGGRDLSDQERAWLNEVRKLEKSVMHEGDHAGREGDDESTPAWKRLEEVKRLKDEMVSQARGTASEDEPDDNEERHGRGANAVKVPSEFRKEKVAQVMELLDRETALVEATTERLNRLSMQAF